MSDKKNIKNNDDASLLKNKGATSTSKNTSEKPTSNTSAAKVVPKQSFSDRWKNNRFWLLRASYHVLRTVWIIVMAIGAFIAWLISMLFI